MDGFRYDAHPMSMLGSTVAALSSFYPEAKNVKDAQVRRIQIDPRDRQDAHARGLQHAPRHGAPLRLPGQ